MPRVCKKAGTGPVTLVKTHGVEDKPNRRATTGVVLVLCPDSEPGGYHWELKRENSLAVVQSSYQIGSSSMQKAFTVLFLLRYPRLVTGLTLGTGCSSFKHV